MSMGAWIIVAVLLVLLGGAGTVAFQSWTAHADVAMPASAYVAMGLGIAFSLVVGCGLMLLVFYSSRQGYDDGPQQIKDPSERDD